MLTTVKIENQIHTLLIKEIIDQAKGYCFIYLYKTIKQDSLCDLIINICEKHFCFFGQIVP